MMISRNQLVMSLLCFLLTTFLFSFHFCSADRLKIYCPDDTFYDNSTANGSAYRNNLDSVLSDLVSNASQPNGFYNYSAGSGDNAVYGLFLCRGDVSTSDCKDCLTSARSDALSFCPDKTRVIVWYGVCMLRYSNQSIFSRLDTSYAWYKWNLRNVSNTPLLNQVLGDTFDQIVNRAANGEPGSSSGKKFAVQDAELTSFQRIYALGQCTPDLSSLDCEKCLRSAIQILPNCCTSRQGARVLHPSCNIRYESSPFYQVSSATPPEPPSSSVRPPSLGPTTATSNDKGGVSTTTIIAIVIPIIAVIIALVLMVFCFVRKAKETQDAAHETSGDLKYEESSFNICSKIENMNPPAMT